MPVRFEIEVDTRRARKRLEKLKEVDDFKKPLKQSAIQIEKVTAQRFRSAKWKPLSDATLKWHPRRVGGKPLNDTGALKKSVTSRAVTHITEKRLEYGTNDKRAPMHNFGGTTKLGTKIPQRKFLYFDRKDEKMIQRIFEDYVKELAGDG